MYDQECHGQAFCLPKTSTNKPRQEIKQHEQTNNPMILLMKHNIKILSSPFWDLDFRIQTSESGHGEIFMHRIRISGQGLPIV